MHLTLLLILLSPILTSSCLLPSDLTANLTTAALPPSPRRDMPIGRGDRFSNGSILPIGLGLRDHKLSSILTPLEIDSGLRALANTFPDDVKLFTPPYKTYLNATLRGLSIGANPRVFVISGVHARERGGPDYLLYFVSDLLQASLARTGLKYGARVYTYRHVVRVLSAGLVFLPLVNPDGVAYDQETDSCWRKNRNPASSAVNVGVDLNRNFDFLWDYTQAYSPLAYLDAVGSNEPASDVYHGKEPMSEPEVKSVAWVLDSFPGLKWFLDLHSFGGDIMYGWGDDNLQVDDAEQNFTNIEYNGRRGVTGIDPPGARYREYMHATDVASSRALATRMKTNMLLAGSTPYVVRESVSLYPTSGTSVDWVQSRWYGGQCGATKVQGLTLEFGKASDAGPCPFYPSSRQYHEWMREVSVGLMEMLLNAAGGTGEPEVREC